MAGHNKWSKIKHKKAAEDAKKSQVFSNLAIVITAEAKRTGGNINDPGLKAAIDRARSVNMPNSNIKRAIDKGVNNNIENSETLIYEGFGPGGVALLIKSTTDNRNRTTPEIKHILSTSGGSLGEPGSTNWAFIKQNGNYKPQTIIDLSQSDKTKLAELINKLKAHQDVELVITNTS